MRRDREGHGDGETVGVLVERGEAGGKLQRQHGEVAHGGVNGLGLLLRVLVDRCALRHRGGDVADGHAETDALRYAVGDFDLVQVTGGVVVNGRPAERAEVLHARLLHEWRGGQ